MSKDSVEYHLRCAAVDIDYHRERAIHAEANARRWEWVRDHLAIDTTGTLGEWVLKAGTSWISERQTGPRPDSIDGAVDLLMPAEHRREGP